MTTSTDHALAAVAAGPESATPRRAAPATTPAARPFEPTDSDLGLAWFLRLRFGAVGGQLLALAAARLLNQELPYAWLLGLVALTLASNIAFELAREQIPGERWLPRIMAFDVLVLGAMLALSGGASNPLTVLFLVHVALAAVLLDAGPSAFLVALTIATFGALFLVPAPTHAHHGTGHLSSHLIGMWIAYAVAAVSVAYFVGRVAKAIRARDRRLADLSQIVDQNQRLAMLSAFSANAAHELGTPLATISLAAEELALSLESRRPDRHPEDDARLIVSEVKRCRDILATLSAQAGESVGEMPVATTLGAIIADTRDLLSSTRRARLDVRIIAPATSQTSLIAPAKTLGQVLHNLLKNAFEAHEATGFGGPVELEVRTSEAPRSPEGLSFAVLDRGPGLSPTIEARLGEPFCTSKSGEGGLGLGVYLAYGFAERIGGSLSFQGRSGGGLAVRLNVPRDVLGSEP